MGHTEYMRKYRSTDIGYKTSVIHNWKHQGLIGDYDYIFNSNLFRSSYLQNS